ncbi:MAG: four-carbon acid sugar kinase family protein [Anaerolineales bacterium]
MSARLMRQADLMAGLPPAWPEDVRPDIRRQLAADGRKVVVLDDDPTGTQTVHGIPVLTQWLVAALHAELENDLAAFYILTNSRSLPLAEAQSLNAAIGQNLRLAAKQAGRDFVVVSRSDSTLRGHFPGEVHSLAQAVQREFDAWLLIPFFLEGGRFTIGDIHYVAQGDRLIPVGETAFARDAAFGFRASNLREWVTEKTAGRIRAEDVASISLEDIRLGGPNAVTERLMRLPTGSICIVNAASLGDIEVFTSGLLHTEARGRRFLYRTAASFVPVRAGLLTRSLLTRTELLGASSQTGGLIVVGSHVPQTTAQVEALLAETGIKQIEINIADLLDDARRQSAIEWAAHLAETEIRRGRDIVVCTSRRLITGQDAADSLSIGQRVSECLVKIVRAITLRPRYILAKGGITSNDMATHGLDVKRAMVLGQILPGVPVWQLGAESRHPGLVYVVFPGNVGGPQALAEVVGALTP